MVRLMANCPPLRSHHTAHLTHGIGLRDVHDANPRLTKTVNGHLLALSAAPLQCILICRI